jgi:Squalene-hopene cyclase C-terminal domain
VLQRTSASFFNEGGCFACHAQNLTGIVLNAARANGFKVDEAVAAGLARGVRIGWSSFEQPLLQRMDPPGGADMLDYALFQMASGGPEADRTTDALVHNLAAMQRTAGNWAFGGTARPPMEDGNFSRTALSIRMMQVFGAPARKAEVSDRIGRASGWLMRATPRTTEDRDMQLLGLKWSNAGPVTIERLMNELAGLQRNDGGWAQTPELSSDAYATGQALYVLREAGMLPSHPVYRRGVEFLVRTQKEDGSWRVVSRAPKFQPYFQSGFPYEHDQWISASGTAWATLSLSYAEAGVKSRAD